MFGKHLWRHDVAYRPVVDIGQKGIGVRNAFVKVFYLRNEQSVEHILVVEVMRQLAKEILVFGFFGVFFGKVSQRRHANADEVLNRHAGSEFGLKCRVIFVLHSIQALKQLIHSR